MTHGSNSSSTSRYGSTRGTACFATDVRSGGRCRGYLEVAAGNTEALEGWSGLGSAGARLPTSGDGATLARLVRWVRLDCRNKLCGVSFLEATVCYMYACKTAHSLKLSQAQAGHRARSSLYQVRKAQKHGDVRAGVLARASRLIARCRRHRSFCSLSLALGISDNGEGSLHCSILSAQARNAGSAVEYVVATIDGRFRNSPQSRKSPPRCKKVGFRRVRAVGGARSAGHESTDHASRP